MIRHEGIITALIGGGIGMPLGVALAALVVQSLSQYGVEFALPVGTLVAFLVVTVLAGLTAALLPARRASRLNVLNALQYEQADDIRACRANAGQALVVSRRTG